MAYDAGTAFLQVVPSFSGVGNSISEEAAKWGDQAAAAFGASFNTGVKEGTSEAQLGPSDGDSSAQGDRSAAAFADGFRGRLEAALQELPEAHLDADSTDADRKIAELRADLETLSNEVVDVDVIDDDAMAKLAEIRAALAAVGADGEDIPVRVDTSAAVGQLDALEAVAAADGEESGTAFGDAFRARLEAAFAALPEAEINADSTPADRKIAEVRAELATLSSEDIGIDVSDSEALAKIAELKAALVAVGQHQADVPVHVDTSAAVAELGGLETTLADVDEAAGAAGGGLAGVESGGAAAGAGLADVEAGAAAAFLGLSDVEGAAGGAGAGLEDAGAAAAPAADGLSAAGADAGEATGAMGGLIGALLALAAALAPIAGLAAGALAGVPSLLAGAASGAGALKLGFSGISGALSAYSTQQSGATKAAATGATAAVNNAASIRDAANTVISAQEAVTNAETSSAQSIASAQEALGNAQTEAANSVHSAQEQLVQSEQSLAEAEYNEQQAQEAVTAARTAAAEQLASYSDQLADASLSSQQAALDVQTAQAALATATQPGSSATSEQQAQAQLTLQQALQRQKELGEAQTTLQTQATAAAAAGVEGNQQVIASEHDLQQAKQATSNAEQSLLDAHVADAQAQASATQKVTDAQNAVTQAETTGAQQIADAQRGLTQALDAQADAAQKVGGASGGAAGQVNQFAQAMAALSPAGQNFVNFLIGLQKQYDSLKDATQTALLPGIQAGITAAEPLFGSLEIFILGAAQAIGNFATQFGTFLGSARGVSEVDAIFAQGAQFMQQLGQAAFTLFGAFLSIGSQAGGVVRALGSGIVDLVNAFAKWAEGGGFQGFLTWLKDNGPGIVSDISSIAKGIGDFIVALVPIGKVVLAVGAFIAKLVEAQPRAAALVFILVGLGLIVAPIVAAIAAMSATMGIVIGVIALLGVAAAELYQHWSTAWSAIRDITNTVWHSIDNDVLHPIEDFFTNTIPHAVSVFSGAITNGFQSVHNILNTVWHALDNDVFHPIANFFTQTVPQSIDTAVGFFQALPGRLTDAVRDIVGTVFGGLLKIGDWLEAHVWAPVSGWFVAVPGRVATAVGDFLSTAWAILLQVGAWLDAHVWGPTSSWFVGVPARLASAIGDFLSTAWAILTQVGTWLEAHVFGPALSWFSSLPGRLANGMGDFLATVFTGLANIGAWLATVVWPAISSFFSGLPAAIATLATGMWDGISSAFESAINDVIGLWNRTVGSLTFTIPGWVPLIGGDSFSMPKIPTLADGGIVSAKTGGVVALVAEGGQDEVISPLDDLADQLRPMLAQMVPVSTAANNVTPPTTPTAGNRNAPAINIEHFVANEPADYDVLQAKADFHYRTAYL